MEIEDELRKARQGRVLGSISFMKVTARARRGENHEGAPAIPRLPARVAGKFTVVQGSTPATELSAGSHGVT